MEQVHHERVQIGVAVQVVEARVRSVGCAKALPCVREHPGTVVAPHLIRLSEVGHEQVKVAVAIHVATRDPVRGAATHALAGVGEHAAGVAPHLVARAGYAQNRIRVAVAVHVGELRRQDLA